MPDIAQFEQPQPQEDLPCFLFFTSLTIIPATIARRRIDIAIVAILFLINSNTGCPPFLFFYFFEATSPLIFWVSEKLAGRATIYTINASARADAISPRVLARAPIVPKSAPVKSEPTQ